MIRPRFYIGLSATIHDSAVAIVGPSGEPLFAEATERYIQRKKAYNCAPDDLIRIPELVARYCDKDGELVAAVTWSAEHLAQLNLLCGPGSPIADPFAHRCDESTWPMPDSAALLMALRNSISQAGLNLASSKLIPNPVRVGYHDHHLTHAANAAFTSPFDDCVVAVVDAYGESASTAFFEYRDGVLHRILSREPARGPTASLGFFYSQVCALCGFDPIKGDEWKVMGLAPYGRINADVYELLKPMIRVDDLTLTPDCSEHEILSRVKALRSISRAADASPLESADLARTGQAVFEEVMTELLDNLSRRDISENLALAGGCALNSSFNGKITERTRFRHLHVPSAPGDDGNALGAAWLAYASDHPDWRPPRRVASAYLGSAPSAETIKTMAAFARFKTLTHGSAEVATKAAALVAENKIVGVFRDRAEFGPRALGNRSILADPRSPDIKDRINAQVKFREEFRPFAPSILDEHGHEFFENYQTSPYMERTLRFRPEVLAIVPGVVHVDGTGRLQSVRREWNPEFYDLIAAFYRITGVPLLLNTSLNIMGRPIAHSVEDALGVLFTTGLDALVVDDWLIEKS